MKQDINAKINKNRDLIERILQSDLDIRTIYRMTDSLKSKNEKLILQLKKP